MQITYIVSYYVCFPTKPVERERKKGGERGRGAERERASLIIFNHIAVHQSNCCLVHSTLGVGRIIVTEYSIFHLVITFSLTPVSGNSRKSFLLRWNLDGENVLYIPHGGP